MTKAEMLDFLKDKLSLGEIEPLVYCSPENWSKDLVECFDGHRLIVRSSCDDEDNDGNSNAGKYDSVVTDYDDVDEAVKEVVSSYPPGDGHHVLIQKYLDPLLTGVAFTRSASGAPYYVINYSEESTDTVTSGRGGKTFVCYRKTIPDDLKMAEVVAAAQEIESVLGTTSLDIEFCFAPNLKILQVRPLSVDDEIDFLPLDQIEIKSVYSVMTDWNPAEIIGIVPSETSLNLYRRLVTDHAWSVRRFDYGYRDMRNTPILTSFLGRPYIDVPVSFESLIPADLSETVAQRLLDHYLQVFRDNPSLHDKVEFEIIASCLTLDDKKLQRIGFSVGSIRDALLDITNRMIGDMLCDSEDLSLLEGEFDGNLYDICVQHGTIPFSGLARLAFVGVEFLKSAVDPSQFNSFLSSIDTISSQIALDAYRMPKEDFLQRYGHLRPDMYNPRSISYRRGYDDYFSNVQPPPKRDVSFQRPNLDKRLKSAGFCFGTDQLFDFAERSIQMREYSKFLFSKCVDRILDLCEDKPASSKLLLPEVILSPRDVYQFHHLQSLPNYITRKSVRAVCADVTGDVKGKVVFIESADPGYDWLFSKGIAGLVTKYGGVNSHMAIRCHELGIPAVLGCGDKYDQWKTWNNITIDCEREAVFPDQ